MKKLVFIFSASLLISCSTKAKFDSYDTQLEQIRNDVRSIRLVADQMKNELINIKTTVDVMNDSVDKQSKEVDIARDQQKKLADMVDGIKASVVKLESETIPQKKAEIDSQKPEKTPLTVVTKLDDGTTRIETLKNIDDAELKQLKYKSADSADVSRTGFGYAVKDGVVLWHSPSRNSEVEEILLSWQQVSILGRLTNDGVNWLKIKTADFTGYVDAKYIIVSE